MILQESTDAMGPTTLAELYAVHTSINLLGGRLGDTGGPTSVSSARSRRPLSEVMS
jgi:hypothetical protein